MTSALRAQETSAREIKVLRYLSYIKTKAQQQQYPCDTLISASVNWNHKSIFGRREHLVNETVPTLHPPLPPTFLNTAASLQKKQNKTTLAERQRISVSALKTTEPALLCVNHCLRSVVWPASEMNVSKCTQAFSFASLRQINVLFSFFSVLPQSFKIYAAVGHREAFFFFSSHGHFDSVRENPDNISHFIVTQSDWNIHVCCMLFLFFSLSAYSEWRCFIWTLECSCRNISVSPAVMKAPHSVVKPLIKVFCCL